jgi:hypothetical protein
MDLRINFGPYVGLSLPSPEDLLLMITLCHWIRQKLFDSDLIGV